jgi:hypothetical protein
MATHVRNFPRTMWTRTFQSLTSHKDSLSRQAAEVATPLHPTDPTDINRNSPLLTKESAKLRKSLLEQNQPVESLKTIYRKLDE